MRTLLKVTLFVLLSLVTISSYAANQVPQGCYPENFTFEKGSLILNAKDNKQRLFFLYNISGQAIEVVHYGKQSFFNSNWQTYIGRGLASAFAADEKQYEIACGIRKETKIDQVPCEQVLSICDYARARFELSNQGSYWVAENQSPRRLVYQIRKKGIRFRRLKRR